jgi:hypothetical protein
MNLKDTATISLWLLKCSFQGPKVRDWFLRDRKRALIAEFGCQREWRGVKDVADIGMYLICELLPVEDLDIDSMEILEWGSFRRSHILGAGNSLSFALHQ